MKKILSILFVLTIAVLLVGCKGKDKEISGSVMIQDENVRRAIALSVDKSYYTDTLLANGSYPADYYVPNGFYAGEGNDGVAVDYRVRAEQLFDGFLPFTKYAMPQVTGQDQTYAPSGYNHFDVATAQKLWADAKERYGVDKDQTVVFEMLVHNNAAWTSLYDHVKAEIEKNLPGSKIKLNIVTFGEKLDKAPTGDFDILFSGWGPDYVDPITYLDLFLSTSGHNNIKYNNPEYDYLIQQAKSGALTGQARFDALVKAEKLLLQDDVAIMPIFQSNSVGLRQPALNDLYTQPVGPDYVMKWANWDETSPWVIANRINNDGKVSINLLETSEIPDMNSSTTTDQVSFYNLAQTNEGLVVAHDPQGLTPYVEGMAADYTVSADGLTYTFNLRADQPWVTSTGAAYQIGGVTQYVTAHDFEFAWKKLADPRIASEYSYLLETMGIEGFDVAYDAVPAEPTAADHAAIDAKLDLLGVNAINATTLEVKLTVAADYFLGMLSFPSFYPINETFYTAMGENYAKSQTPANVLYNGAYYMSDWGTTGHTLTKNELYWDKDVVNIDVVNYLLREALEADNQVQMYLDGTIDTVVLRTAALVETYGARSDRRITGTTTAWYLEFNMNNH